MKTMRSVLMSAAVGGALLTAATLPALAFGWEHPGRPTPPGHGAPGPLVGAGLPFAVVGLGALWLLKRRRQSV
jgi:hypothetical protein